MSAAFIRYLAVAVLARIADEGARVVLVLLALDRTSSPAFGGQLVAALLVPHVVAAPALGALADRVRHRRAFHAASMAVFGAALALCGVLAGRVAAPVVLLVIAVGGGFAPLLTGGLSSLLRDLVPEPDLSRGYGLDAVSYNVAGICGPAVAASLAGAAGPAAGTVTLGAIAVAAGLLLCTLPIARHTGPAAGLNLTRGITVLWRNRTLRSVTLASSLGALGLGGLPLVAALLNPSLAGWFLSAAAAGGLLGALGYARRPLWTHTPERIVLVGLLAIAAPLALIPLVSGPAARLVLFGASGFSTGPVLSALLATRQRQAPRDAHTQVFTIAAGLKITAAAVGAALAGAYAGLGAGPLLLAMAGCQVLGAVVGLALRSSRGRPGSERDVHRLDQPVEGPADVLR